MGERKLNYNAPFLSVRRNPTEPSCSTEKDWKVADKLGSDRSNGSLGKSTAVTIPFLWEKMPGRPTGNNIALQPYSSEECCLAPESLPGVSFCSKNYPPEEEEKEQKTDSTSGLAQVGKSLIRLRSPRGSSEGGVSDSEDEEYCDALDTLSLSDSFGTSQRVSAVSFSDKRVPKPNETSSAGLQIEDFMMNRFLPAAKAMALEQPHCPSKRQPATMALDQSILSKNVVASKREPNFTLYESIVRQHYLRDIIDEESEDGEENQKWEDYDIPDNDMSERGCGLLPHLCFKNSLALLHAAPALKLDSMSMYSGYDHGKPNKASRFKSFAQTVKKLPLVFDSANKQRPNAVGLSRSAISNANKLNGESSWLTTLPGRESPLRQSVPSSPYRNAVALSPTREAVPRTTVKDAENIRANRLNKHVKSRGLLFPKSNIRSSNPTSSTAKETLPIDAYNIFEGNCKINSASKYVRGSQSLGSLFKDSNETSMAIDQTSSSLDEELGHNRQSPEPSKVNLKVSDGCGYQKPKVKTGPGFGSSGLSPPLPSTPSDSWLSRNLNSTASRNPFLNPYLRSRASPRKQRPGSLLSSTKWETIVKSSHSYYEHICHSKELITHLSKQPES